MASTYIILWPWGIGIIIHLYVADGKSEAWKAKWHVYDHIWRIGRIMLQPLHYNPIKWYVQSNLADTVGYV